MDYIKSPLNYVGGKYKLLPQILPLFPKEIDTFYDLFGGGANVSVNVQANKVVYNDLNLRVVQMLEAFKNNRTSSLISYIDSIIDKYNLSKTNAEGFLELRKAYNAQTYKDPVILYTIICHAFNYQIRFNNKGEYNMPFGKDRSSFNNVLRGKFVDFCERLHNINICFTNCNYEEFWGVEFGENDFVYCDPPYFNSTATYNERNGWSEQDEQNLYDFLNLLTCSKVRWALSNNLAVNPLLKDFCDKFGYNIHYLNTSYGNCNYHKKDKKSKDCEVLITNY